MKAVCGCGFEFYTEFARGVICPRCGAVVALIKVMGVVMPEMVPDGWVVGPSVCGRADRVWLGSPTGEGGDFDREEVEAVMTAGFATGEMGDMLERFFWENF